jgi:type II secretory ATPase GspE/PulE/Tfp pilus assembly ATPase PilB-like protein
VKEEELQSVLRFSAAQRLLKRLCPTCSRLAEPSAKAELECLGWRPPAGSQAVLKNRNPLGCKVCHEGVVGRLPALEYIDESGLRDAIGCVNPGDFLFARTLKESAFQLAARGEVDCHEVFTIG